MRANHQIVEAVAKIVAVWEGHILGFGADWLLAQLPTDDLADVFLKHFKAGPVEVGLLIQKGEKPEQVLFRWKCRRG